MIHDGSIYIYVYYFFVFNKKVLKNSLVFLFLIIGEFIASGSFVNGAAHHVLHHLYFNYNYGQYFTIWDKIGGSYRKPSAEQFDVKKKKDQKIWEKQATEVDSFDENGKEKKL
jgi:lathosterol oxidase